LFGSPTGTVRSFLTAAQKGDVDGMTNLFSKKAIEKSGIDKIRSNNESFADLNQKASSSSGNYQMDELKEKRDGDTARVSFVYRNDNRTDSVKLVFDLSKEGGVWKIDDIGGAEKELESSDPVQSSAKPAEPPPLPAPQTGSPEGTKTIPRADRAPISGGVLNSKAIVCRSRLIHQLPGPLKLKAL
jgi:hypothetical protein